MTGGTTGGPPSGTTGATAGGTTGGPPGPVLFARYAYPPNSLGYCGPGDPAALIGLATDDRPHPGELRHLAAAFEGAWPYLELIAGCNGIGDPLDRRVVEAYWIGNGLLAGVPPLALRRSLDDRFHRRGGGRMVVAPVPFGAVPHHSFHVFAVYPWVGLLRSGREEPALTVLDRCRIRWGTVESVTGDLVVVRCRQLAFEGSRLVLGQPVCERVRRSIDGVGFAADLAAGDTVSLHWDWVCERLRPDQATRLRHWTARTLAAVNAAPASGPARAVGV